LLLGIVTQIIINKIVPEELTSEELLKEKLKGKKKKIDLVIELLKNNSFLIFLGSIKYYEWESNNEIKKRNFWRQSNLYLASHHRQLEKS
jgi:hypothetical protein